MCQILGRLSTTKGKWKDDRGATIVEFAIVLPLLLLLIFGIIEFGLLLYNKQILTNASREGARAGVQQAAPPGVPNQSPNRHKIDQIHDVVKNYCSAHLVNFGSQLLTFSTLADSGCVSSCLSSSEKLQVKISYEYQFLIFPSIIIGVFNGSMNDTITLTADTIMTCE